MVRRWPGWEGSLEEPGLPVLLGAEAATLADILNHVDERYGGVERYLAGAGLGPDVVARLRDRLVE